MPCQGRNSNAELQTQLATAQAEAAQLQGVVDRLQRQLEEAKQVKVALESESSEAGRKLYDVKEQLRASVKEQMGGVERMEALEREKAGLEDRLAAMQEGEGAAVKEMAAQLGAAEEARQGAEARLEEVGA